MPSLLRTLSCALAIGVLVAGCGGGHGERIDAECIADLGCQDGEHCAAGRCVRIESASVTVTGEVLGAPTGVRVEAPRVADERCAPGAEQDLICSVEAGAGLVLIAPEVPGFRFAGWRGLPPCTGSERELALQAVTGDLVCTAEYVARFQVRGESEGASAPITVQAAPPAVCDGARCEVDRGASATLTAASAPGMQLQRWSGAGCEAAGAAALVRDVQADTICRAHYVAAEAMSGPALDARHRVEASAAPVEGGVVAVTSASPGATCEAQRCEVESGSAVTLEARANAGFRFTGWAGAPACSGTSARLELGQIGMDVGCTAAFAPQIEIAGDAAPPGTGIVVVAADAPGAVCGPGRCTVDAGSGVLLTASPADGYRFVRWSGCGNADDPRLAQTPLSMIANASQRCTATFERIVYSVQAVAEPGGSVLAQAAGAPCADARCSVEAGGDVTLLASPATGYTFSGWSGCPSDAAVWTLSNVRADHTCVARFARVRIALTGSSSPSGLATVQASSTSPSASCAGASCAVDYGESARLDVVDVAAGYRFARWTGCAEGEASGRSISLASLTRDQSCQAVVLQQRIVRGVAVPSEGGSVSCAEGCQINDGSRIELTALPQAGWMFSQWQGCVQTEDPVLVLAAVTSDQVCEAVFERIPMLF